MGTRADFYVGCGKSAEWIGSIGWDGNPEGIDDSVLQALTESDYRARANEFFEKRDDATLPAYGWPWPWDDSGTTDYHYAFYDGCVWVGSFGRGWVRKESDLPEKDGYPDWDSLPTVEFPDMSEAKNVSWGKRSGLITIVGGEIVED